MLFLFFSFFVLIMNITGAFPHLTIIILCPKFMLQLSPSTKYPYFKSYLVSEFLHFELTALTFGHVLKACALSDLFKLLYSQLLLLFIFLSQLRKELVPPAAVLRELLQRLYLTLWATAPKLRW